jgi:uncharacterized protein YcbX
MASPHLAQLWTYPVKSFGGAPYDTALVEPWGLAGDRRFMVTDRTHRFLTQREHPRMALIHAAGACGTLILTAPDKTTLTIGPGGTGCQVQIWRDTVTARDCGDEPAAWLSAILDLPVRLVHLADPSVRKIKPAYAATPADSVSFADGFPILLTSANSLADLNTRLAHPVPMTRFRPNLVIANAPAWAEDSWRRIRIGATVFRIAKPCDRCIMTTLDPLTATQPDGNEPLRTLASFRRDAGGGLMFGQNLVPEQCGELRVGDAVDIIDSGPPNVYFRPPLLHQRNVPVPGGET